jgi:hypothetical protein
MICPGQMKSRMFAAARVAAVLSAAALSGCAGLTIKPVPNDAADNAAEGFRYYRSAPFLLVYADNKGGLETKILYLPDTTKKMSVHPYSYLASNNATLVFDKGRLTQAKAEVDETVIPAAAVAALETVAKELVAAKLVLPTQPIKAPAPYLFRIVKKQGHWTLEGGQGQDQQGKPAAIRITPFLSN